MSIFVVDIEADGPIPGDYSMIEIGAVLLKEGDFDVTFHSQVQPISKQFSLDALRVTGYTREDTMSFEIQARTAMLDFERFVLQFNGPDTRPEFWSDNNGFDWMFVCWYMWHFLGHNVFGHSSANINYLYKGIQGSMKKSFKKLRKTKHTHNPVDDAIGNAEALREIVARHNILHLSIAPERMLC